MNIGILGTGSIARTMAAEFAKVPAFRCEAVCSRQQATGEALAQQFGIPKVYTDYDAMLADPDIELVYIATPNSLHYAQTKAALLAGKNVLCEKPFVPTVAEADELIALYILKIFNKYGFCGFAVVFFKFGFFRKFIGKHIFN